MNILWIKGDNLLQEFHFLFSSKNYVQYIKDIFTPDIRYNAVYTLEKCNFFFFEINEHQCLNAPKP